MVSYLKVILNYSPLPSKYNNISIYIWLLLCVCRYKLVSTCLIVDFFRRILMKNATRSSVCRCRNVFTASTTGPASTTSLSLKIWCRRYKTFFGSVTFGWTDIWSNWHLVKPTFGQTNIWSNWHLVKLTFGKTDIW